ncbi:MAG: TIGR03768 family metallophosphoesterase [Actinomycetes bacterium]
MCTTQVLDAAIQTVNVLHRRNPFDFGISLGDTCNNTSYNELRWYLDVIDGKVIHPSSGANIGADSIDYQKPYQAVGLDPSISWYQALGNHDHFYIGSFPVDADPTMGLRQSYVAGTVWAVGDVLKPNICNFPRMIDMEELKAPPPMLYGGVFDGASPYGTVMYTGPVADSAYAAGAPKVAADPGRRSLLRKEWVQEFFNTTTVPKGHGFNLVDPALNTDGFACYSFVPSSKIPLKIIVLDDTQSEYDGSTDIHGHGYLDATRWAWLQKELAQGQANNQLMIIAAHCPIGVSAVGSETEWWAQTDGIDKKNQNAVGLTGLVRTLWNTPNLLMWIAGHRHLNVVKAFKPFDPPGAPEQAFWQVETSSLRDWPQQFRTFDIYLNTDYTVSIVTTNVDPSVAEGTPAAASRKYAIAVQQIVQNNVTLNNPNLKTKDLGCGSNQLPTMDPSRIQTDQDVPAAYDATIQFVDMTQPRFPLPVPVNGSCNGQLFKQLSPQMVAVLKTLFPPAT